MKTHTFSVVVGTGACNAKCPFCVSKMTCRAQARTEINWDRFETACGIASQARDGLVNVLLTGTGEPSLYPLDISDLLMQMKGRFPLVTLQTNGVLLTRPHLRDWKQRGLTAVCLSITSASASRSNEIMGIKDDDYNYWECAKMLHDEGLSVRLNCTMLRDGVSQPEQVEDLIDKCLTARIEQLTLREVDRPADPASAPLVAQYVDDQKPRGAATKLYHYMAMKGGTQLMELPHGGTVFDYRDQNVCITNCLTDTRDPDDIRQIIFFPNGEISYDWKYKGARIL
jgi:molybdenum cofactor biosynthesis enzyme MoaA